MIDAVLAGEGVARVAALAAVELGGTVTIAFPALDIFVAEPRIRTLPALVAAEVPVRSGDERLGTVALLGGDPAGAREVLELAALAALTAVTLRDESITRRRAGARLLDELADLTAAEIVARGRRLGADLSGGAGALCVRAPSGAVERVLAMIAQDIPGALAAVRSDRVDALLPALPAADAAAAEASARRLLKRVRRTAPAALAPFEPDAGALARSLRAAELALAVSEREDRDPLELLNGSWRLLLGVAANDPTGLRAVVAGSVGPIAARPGLLETLRAYLDRGASINAASAAVLAHRHTVARRLEQIAQLTGHDPQTPYGQAELALGLRALALAQADDSRHGRRLRVVG